MENQGCLEALKVQLVNSLKALKEHEELLTSVDTNQEEQIKNEKNFKNELDSALKSLESVPKTFTQASNQISSVYTIAQDLSYRINVIDEAYSRCQAAAEHVKMLADLFECLGSIDEAIEKEDVENSCNIISRLIQIPKKLLTAEDSEKVDGYRKKALDLLKKQMESGEEPGAIFYYYEKCGAAAEGVREYTNIQYKDITQTENPKYVVINQMKPSTLDDTNESLHIKVFVEFLNSICIHINESKTVIKDDGQFAVFIRLLLQLADSKMKQIIEIFIKYRSVFALLDAQQKPNPGFSSLVCEEMATIAKQYAQFQKFITNLVKPGKDTDFFKSFPLETRTNQQTGMPVNTESEREIAEILSYYTILTNNFANTVIREEMFEKLKMFEGNQETMDIISDIFFFFNEMLTRTFRTKSAKTAVSVCNLVSDLVRNLFEILKKMDSKSQSKAKDITGIFGIIWNALDLADVHILKLIETFERSNKNFSGDESEIIKSTISEYKKFSDDLKQGVNRYLKLAMNNLQPAIDSLINIFKFDWTRESSTVQINVELEMSIESEFTQQYEKFFTSYINTLNKANKDRLIFEASTKFAIMFEGLIKGRQFDQKGAVLSDRLIKFFGKTLTEQPFSRLRQIAFIITRENPDEIKEVFTDNPPMEWTLTKEEVASFSQLRVEWK